MKYIPKYDVNYKPAYLELNKFFKKSTKVLKIAIQRNNGLTYRKDIPITDDYNESYFYVERIIKTLLWLVGGYKIFVSGDYKIYLKLKEDYSEKGVRSFDYKFMSLKLYMLKKKIYLKIREKISKLVVIQKARELVLMRAEAIGK